MSDFAKKRTLDDITGDIDALSPEEKAKIGKRPQNALLSPISDVNLSVFSLTAICSQIALRL